MLCCCPTVLLHSIQSDLTQLWLIGPAWVDKLSINTEGLRAMRGNNQSEYSTEILSKAAFWNSSLKIQYLSCLKTQRIVAFIWCLAICLWHFSMLHINKLWNSLKQSILGGKNSTGSQNGLDRYLEKVLSHYVIGMIQTILTLDCQKICGNLRIILMFVLDLTLTSYMSPAGCCHRGENWAISLMQDDISYFISHNVPNATPHYLGYLKSCAMPYKTLQLNSSLLQYLKRCFWKFSLIKAQD